MAKNHEDKVYAGGIRNRINRITLRTGGDSTASYNSNFTGQTIGGSGIDPRSVISRTTRPEEPPVERSSQEGVKDNDV